MRLTLFRIILLSTMMSGSLAFADSSREYTTNVVKTGKQVLDTPFHFLLTMPDYIPERLANQSDMSSAWGHLVLARKANGSLTVAVVRAKLIKAARQKGWISTDRFEDIEEPDLSRYGMSSRTEDLALTLTKGEEKQGPPTRYGCRVWIAPDGRRIVIAYRVDGE